MEILYGLGLGLVMGTLSGMGVGGGKLVVPVLVLFLGFSQQLAQGAVLLAFLPLAAIAVAQHWRQGTFDAPTALRILPTAGAGAALGASVALTVASDGLRTVYGLFLMLMGVYEWLTPAGEEVPETKG